MIQSHTRSNAEHNTVVINRLSKANDYDYSQPHRHDYFELFYFQKGGGVHEIDFKPFDIHSASFQLVVPGQVHQMRRTPGSMGFVFIFTNQDVIDTVAQDVWKNQSTTSNAVLRNTLIVLCL